jgi:hypothetical protein
VVPGRPGQLFELFIHAVYGLLPVAFFASALQPQEAPEGSRAGVRTIATRS